MIFAVNLHANDVNTLARGSDNFAPFDQQADSSAGCEVALLSSIDSVQPMIAAADMIPRPIQRPKTTPATTASNEATGTAAR